MKSIILVLIVLGSAIAGRFVSVLDYGARGDGVTNDSAAIQNAINNGRPILIPYTGDDYCFSGQLTNPNGVPIVCDGSLMFTGSGEDAIIIGGSTSTQYAGDIESVVWLKRDSLDWSDGYAGIVLKNMYNTRISIQVDGFETGLKLVGDNTGCAYNIITINRLKNNRTGLQLCAIDTNGFCNQNTFIGGRFSTSSSTNNAYNIYGVEFNESSGHPINGNAFYNPCFELNNVGSGWTSCFNGAGTAKNNIVFGFRFEATDYVLSGEGIFGNTFYYTYTGNYNTILKGSTDADNLTLANNRFVKNGDLLKSAPVSIVKFGHNNLVAFKPGANEWVSCPGFGIWYDGGVLDVTGSSKPAKLKNDHIEIDRNYCILGVKFDLSKEPALFLKNIHLKASIAGSGGRFAAVCFDSLGNILTSANDCSFGYNSDCDFHRTGSDMIGGGISETSIYFGDNVKTAIIGVTDGTEAVLLKSLEYFVLGDAAVEVELDTNGYQLFVDAPIAPEQPVIPDGYAPYKEGFWVKNSDMSSCTIGWVFNGTYFENILK